MKNEKVSQRHSRHIGAKLCVVAGANDRLARWIVERVADIAHNHILARRNLGASGDILGKDTAALWLVERKTVSAD